MQLRKLDIDDLLVLSLLLAGHGQRFIAAEMGLSQPAISQRIIKINGSFEFKVYTRITREGRLTPAGVLFATRAKESLKLLTDAAPYTFSLGRGKMLLDLVFKKLPGES